MNRQEKTALIESLKADFSAHPTSFIVGFKGLSVSEAQQLRRSLREKGAKLKVAKARLMKLAAQDNQNGEMLLPFLKNQVALVFAQEAPEIAKVLTDFAKDHDSLTVLAASFGSQLLETEAIAKIASLPSREVLLAQLCAVLQAPMAKFVRVLGATKHRLIWTLENVAKSKQ